MNVSSINQATTSSPVDSLVGGNASKRRLRAALDAVSQMFGMSPRQLADAVASGRSMMSIASEKGISPMDLMAAIRNAMLMPPNTDENLSPAKRHELDQAAHQLATHVGPLPFGSHPAETSAVNVSLPTAGHLDVRA